MSRPGMTYKAVLDLFVAANFWGFGFIATIWALEAMGPLWITAWRFVLAFAVSIPLFFLFRTQLTNWRQSLWLTIVPGIFLSLTLIPQTWGLRYTTATKSGFITCLYVVIVPLIERFLFRRPLSFLQILSVLIAIAGTGLIADLRTFDSVNLGDLLTLICAFAAAGHILAVGHYGPMIPSPFLFNTFQSLWAGLIALAFAIACEPFRSPVLSGEPLAGLLLLSFGSTLFAFMLQVRSQKFLSPTTASMLFLLESPLAAFYAYLVLNEHPSPPQWAGGILILVAAIISVFEANSRGRKSILDSPSHP